MAETQMDQSPQTDAWALLTELARDVLECGDEQALWAGRDLAAGLLNYCLDEGWACEPPFGIWKRTKPSEEMP